MFGGSDTKILLIVIIRLASLFFYGEFFQQILIFNRQFYRNKNLSNN